MDQLPDNEGVDLNNLEERATHLRDNGQADEAIVLYQQLLESSLARGELRRAAGAQHMIGVSYKIADRLPEALEAYRLSVPIYQEAGDAVGPGRVYRDIGLMYLYKDKFDEAREWLEQSRQSIEEIAEPEDQQYRDAELGITLTKIGLLDQKEGRLDDAQEHFALGHELVRRGGNEFYEMTTLMHIAALDLQLKQPDTALDYLEACWHIINKNQWQDKQKRRIAELNTLAADAYAQKKNLPEALHSMDEALSFVSEMDKESQVPLLREMQRVKIFERLNYDKVRLLQEFPGLNADILTDTSA